MSNDDMFHIIDQIKVKGYHFKSLHEGLHKITLKNLLKEVFAKKKESQSSSKTFISGPFCSVN